MKKQRRKPATKKRAQAPAAATPQRPDRRALLVRARNWGIGAAVLGIGGVFSVRSVQATIAEHDLERIGQGVPMVVQIHDPSCPLCRALQKETRAALKQFEPEALQYVIADINTREGRALANRHRVQHVTLLLMDGRGRVQDILHGSQDREVLAQVFTAHLERRGR